MPTADAYGGCRSKAELDWKAVHDGRCGRAHSTHSHTAHTRSNNVAIVLILWHLQTLTQQSWCAIMWCSTNKLYQREATPMAPRICTCGREIRPFPHCISCGSFNVYGKSTNSIRLQLPNTGQGTDVPAEYLTARGFKCRRCLTEFHEAEACEAPTFESKSMAQRRKVDEAGAKVSTALQEAGGSRQELLKQMFGKKEAKP